MNYEQWHEKTTELQNKYGYTGKPKGKLSQVSLYEFVNDWLRPELQWKIFSYLAECPHKSLLQQVQQGHMPQFIPNYRFHSLLFYGQIMTPDIIHSRIGFNRRGKGRWFMPMDIEYTRTRSRMLEEDPENLPMVLTLKEPHRQVMDDLYWRGLPQERNQMLKYLNDLRESNGNGHWEISKKDLLQHLKENNVKGRTKLANANPPPGRFQYGTRISNNRKEVITALMKL